MLLLIMTNLSYANNATPYDQGVKLYEEGKYELSLVFLERAFDENPLIHEQLYFYLGNIYNHKKNYKKAIESYHRGLEMASDENQDSFKMNLAKSYLDNKQYEKAIELYDELEKTLESKSDVLFYKGMAYFNLEDKDNAVTAWQNYLDNAPQDEPQYDSVKRAIDLLKDPEFKFGKKKEVTKGARDEDKKLTEDDKEAQDKKMTDEEIKQQEDDLVSKLEEQEEMQAISFIKDSIAAAKIDSEKLCVADQEKKEGRDFDEVER